MMFTIFGGRSAFFQWDLNQKIIVGLPCQQVHFCINGKTLSTEVRSENEQNIANVPNELLQYSGRLKIFAYVIDNSQQYTFIECYRDIICRPKPPDYVYTPTEVLDYNTLREKIGDLDSLQTQEKSNLVAAINEVLKMSGSDVLPKITVEDDGKVLTAESGIWVAKELPTFSGSYEVTPTVEAQNVATAKMYMERDLTINAIPYAEVTNGSNGKTVTIA